MLSGARTDRARAYPPRSRSSSPHGGIRLRGRRPLIVAVPVLSPRLSSYWLHLVTPVNARTARPLIEGLRNPTVARETRIRELVPLRLTPFDEAALAALRARG
jgi:hypothetical protein